MAHLITQKASVGAFSLFPFLLFPFWASSAQPADPAIHSYKLTSKTQTWIQSITGKGWWRQRVSPARAIWCNEHPQHFDLLWHFSTKYALPLILKLLISKCLRFQRGRMKNPSYEVLEQWEWQKKGRWHFYKLFRVPNYFTQRSSSYTKDKVHNTCQETKMPLTMKSFAWLPPPWEENCFISAAVLC